MSKDLEQMRDLFVQRMKDDNVHFIIVTLDKEELTLTTQMYKRDISLAAAQLLSYAGSP